MKRPFSGCRKEGISFAENHEDCPLRRPAHKEKFCPYPQGPRKPPHCGPQRGVHAVSGKCLWQIKRPRSPISARVNVRCVYYMKTARRVDLANLIEATTDILVKAKVLADDNSQIVAAHDGSRVDYDKKNPRAEIWIEEME